MLFGQLQEVFLCHTFEACIAGVGRQGERGRFEPVVQGLGMNPKQASTHSYRKRCHEQDSFQRKTQEETRRTTAPGNVPELPDFPDIALKSRKLGNREGGYPILVEKGGGSED
jgi:hypothetical protein